MVTINPKYLMSKISCLFNKHLKSTHCKLDPVVSDEDSEIIWTPGPVGESDT